MYAGVPSSPASAGRSLAAAWTREAISKSMIDAVRRAAS